MNDNNWEVNATGTQRILDEKDLEIERLKDKIKVLEKELEVLRAWIDRLTMSDK